MKFDKPCTQCGEIMVGVNQFRTVCDKCKKEKAKIREAEYRKMRRKQRTYEQRFNVPAVIKKRSVCDKYCRGCVYNSKLYNGVTCCTYYLDTGNRRPCTPGKDCTERVTGKKLQIDWTELGG